MTDIVERLRRGNYPWDIGVSVVYVVAIGKCIKIGFSMNIADRLRSFLTTSTDIHIQTVIPGDRQLERKLHGLLAECRITRELFRQDWRIDRFVELANDGKVEEGIEYLIASTPQQRTKRIAEESAERRRVQRQTKAELDAHFAALVAERKLQLGW